MLVMRLARLKEPVAAGYLFFLSTSRANFLHYRVQLLRM